MELKLEQVVIKDDDLVVFFPYDAITEGELIVAPIGSFKYLEDLPDFLVEKMFHVVNKMSGVLFDVLGCHGTNLVIHNGVDAGFESASLFMRIIPRFQDDGLSFKWEPKQASNDELESTFMSFKNFEDLIKANEFVEKQKEKTKDKVVEEIKNDYLLKSLRRNP